MLFTFCYHLYNLKNLKNIYEELLLLELQSKSNSPPWMFLTFFKLYKWHQIWGIAFHFLKMSHCAPSLHKKWSFPSRISSVNVTKSTIWSHLLNKPLIENFIFCAVPISSWSLFKKKAPQLNEKWNILRTLRNKNLFQETQICFPIYISKIKYSGICSSFMAKVHIM